ncbi:hypothetical protein [Phenylobacterium sp.]|uniref:hypothetical protein n=1 Tax=Phenylobacterium sp. TaxID=1871053 RepID=UPI00374D2BF2
MIARRLTQSLIAAAVLLAAALGLKFAERGGLVSHDMALRAVQALIGLGLAVYANVMPKRLGRFRNPAAAQRAQAALRTGGWAFTLGGLGYAVTSLLPVPDLVPVILLSTATAYVLGYAAWAFATCPPPGATAPGANPSA